MYALMSDFKVLFLITMSTFEGKLRWSLMTAVMDVDLLLGTEQALMLHFDNIVACMLL